MGKWKQGLWGCCSNGRGCTHCCCTCCLWPLAMGLNAEKAGLGNGVLWVMAHSVGGLITCLCSGTLIRMKIREQHGIDGSCCGDCLATCCCGPCALCQETAQTRSMDDALSPLTGIKGDEKVHPVTSQPM